MEIQQGYIGNLTTEQMSILQQIRDFVKTFDDIDLS